MTNSILQPIDRVAITLILLLSLIMGILVWSGSNCQEMCWFRTGPKVKDFSWNKKIIGAEDRAFTITFDRPMAQASVEENLLIDPPLPGKFSWSGRRLAYTLENPAPYGTNYKLVITGARESFKNDRDSGNVMQPFVAEFSSRDRIFAYIGLEGKERGHLILYNWTKQEKTILTGDNLIVTDFKFNSQGNKILFFAHEIDQNNYNNFDNQLYSLTLQNNPNQQQIQLLLNSDKYHNLKFDLSSNGKTIVVQRMSKDNNGGLSLWKLENGEIKPLNNSSGGEFIIAPDGNTIALSQGEGISLLSLETDGKPISFLSKFGKVVNFSADGTLAAMINFNKDNPELLYTRSLFLVSNQGLEKKILDINGSILDCKFNPNATILYCLLTELINEKKYLEQPYFAEINLTTNQILPLLVLPNYQDIHMSIASDGLSLLFDQVLVDNKNNQEIQDDILKTNSGENIVSGRLWLLIPPSVKSSESTTAHLEDLPLIGFRPQWSP